LVGFNPHVNTLTLNFWSGNKCVIAPVIFSVNLIPAGVLKTNNPVKRSRSRHSTERRTKTKKKGDAEGTNAPQHSIAQQTERAAKTEQQRT